MTVQTSFVQIVPALAPPADLADFKNPLPGSEPEEERWFFSEELLEPQMALIRFYTASLKQDEDELDRLRAVVREMRQAVEDREAFRTAHGLAMSCLRQVEDGHFVMNMRVV